MSEDKVKGQIVGRITLSGPELSADYDGFGPATPFTITEEGRVNTQTSGFVDWVNIANRPTWITGSSLFGQSLVTAADGVAGRTILGLGNAAVANVGTGAGTVAAGDDTRLSDARAPLTHTQDWGTITSTPTTLAGYGITDAASGTINNGTLTLAVIGVGLAGSATFTANQSGSSTFTVSSNATSANTASTIVARDGSGNFTAGTITAALTGNASTATTLQNPRTINGTSFNGSANITTANWGTARSITIGSTSRTVDGSVNYTWSLADIGAQAASANLTSLGANNSTYYLDRVNHTGVQAASTITGLATVATTGAYSNLSGLPTLGTAAALNVAVSGNAAAGEVVKGSDSRLSDSRAPIAHNQAWSTITSTPTTLSGYGITDALTTNTAQFVDGFKTFRNALGVKSEVGANQDAVVLLGRAGGTSAFSVSLTPTTLTANRILTLPNSTGTVALTSDIGAGLLTLATSGIGLSASAPTFNANQTVNTTFTITSNATSDNTANTIVSRNSSGNFTAGTITATLSGNATTATTLATARTIGMTGDVTWTSAPFNGSGNVTGTATLANSGVTAGTYAKTTVDAKGRVTSGTTLSDADIPTLTASKISNFDTQVRTSRLDQMAAPTGSLSLNSQKIISLGSPTLATDAATKAYVDGMLSANDAMVFKGTLGTGGTYTSLPTTHSVGWTIRVVTAGTYAGQVAEVGDMYVSLVNRTGSGNVNADWTLLQTNIDGAVVGPASSTNDHVALFNGTTGKLLKSAGVVLGSGTLTVNTSGIGLSGTGTFGANQATNATITLSSNATSANTASTVVARDASGNFSAGTITAALTGNSSSATTLATSRSIWGQSFNGSANITGNLTSVGNITGTGAITISAGGTNQSITLTPTGTGTVNAPTFNATSTTAGGFQGIDNDSRANPSFTWTGDLDTGMYRSGVDNISFSTGGEPALTLGVNNNFTFRGFFISPASDDLADSTNTTRNSSQLYWRGRYWNGSASVNTDWNSVYVPTDTAGNGEWRLRNSGGNRLVVNNAGTVTANTFAGQLTGNASTATTLETSRTIGGVSFNGSANINLPGVNTTGNQNTTGSAATLTTSRNIWGRSFNGSADVTGNLTSVGNITGTGAITVSAGGTNQSITLTPTGTGTVNAPTFNATSTTAGGFQGIADDSAAMPSFTWTGDLNTGMYHFAPDLIGFSAGGVIALTLSNFNNFSQRDFILGPYSLEADSVNTLRNSSQLRWRGRYWNGSASVNTDWNTLYIPTDTLGNGEWRLRNDTSNRLVVDNSGTVTATTFAGALTGNASTATTLQTTRSINGTNFNGSANITTANWGTARTLTIGATGKSVNGSGGVSWTTEEVLPARLRNYATTITNWNDANTNGWYMGQGATNAPVSVGWYLGNVEAHNSQWCTQTVHPFTQDSSTNTQVWRRELNAGVWGSWYRLILSEDEQAVVTRVGAASSPARLFTGTWFTGGTSTTTKPQLLLEPTGTTSTGWSVNGTGLGVNAPSGFTGNLMDLQINGSSRLSMTPSGSLLVGTTTEPTGSYAGSVVANNRVVIGSQNEGISQQISGNHPNITATTGTLAFRFQFITTAPRAAIVRLRVSHRANNNVPSDSPAAEYVFQLHTTVAGECTINGTTTDFEYTYVRATHFSFTNHGSYGCSVTLANPTAFLLIGSYHIDILCQEGRLALTTITTT